jgi:hypothetical protein
MMQSSFRSNPREKERKDVFHHMKSDVQNITQILTTKNYHKLSRTPFYGFTIRDIDKYMYRQIHI